MLNLLVGGTMLLSASQVAISGDTDCPTPADIRRYLVPLLPDTRDAAVPDRVVLEMGSETELQVILTNVDGVILKKRAIPRSSACDHLAETVAVLIASWETELHPGWSPIIEPPTERTNAPPSNTNNGLAAWTTIGTSLSDAAGSIAPAVSLGFALGPRRGRWTARLSAIGVAAHKATLGPGEISWKRLSAAAGIGTTVGSGPIDLDIEAAGVAPRRRLVARRAAELARRQRRTLGRRGVGHLAARPGSPRSGVARRTTTAAHRAPGRNRHHRADLAVTKPSGQT